MRSQTLPIAVSSLLATALFFAGGVSALAATISVPKDQPTIQDAVDAAADGDTIVVKKGTYSENVVVDGNAGKNNLTIRGAGKPVVDGGGAGDCLTIVNASGVTVTGMSFRNADVNGVLLQNSSDIKISKCSSFDNGDGSRSIGAGIRVETSSDVTIEKCKLTDNGHAGIRLFDPAGNTVTNCTLEKNKCNGGREGLSMQGMGHTIVKNKLSDQERIGIFLDDESGDVSFEKNTVKEAPDWALLVVGGSGHTFMKNKYFRSEVVEVSGDDISMTGEKILRGRATGLTLHATNSTLRGLKLVGCGDHGLDVRGTGNLIEGCKIIQTKDTAIKARDGPNTFRNNTAKRSRDFDLDDSAGEGVNTYENNKFDPDKVDPEGLAF